MSANTPPPNLWQLLFVWLLLTGVIVLPLVLLGWVVSQIVGLLQ